MSVTAVGVTLTATRSPAGSRMTSSFGFRRVSAISRRFVFFKRGQLGDDYTAGPQYGEIRNALIV